MKGGRSWTRTVNSRALGCSGSFLSPLVPSVSFDAFSRRNDLLAVASGPTSPSGRSVECSPTEQPHLEDDTGDKMKKRATTGLTSFRDSLDTCAEASVISVSLPRVSSHCSFFFIIIVIVECDGALLEAEVCPFARRALPKMVVIVGGCAGREVTNRLSWTA